MNRTSFKIDEQLFSTQITGWYISSWLIDKNPPTTENRSFIVFKHAAKYCQGGGGLVGAEHPQVIYDEFNE